MKKFTYRLAEKLAPKFCLYNIRHTWMNRLLTSGVDALTVAILAGRYHWISLSAEVYAIDYVPFVPRAIDALLVAAVSLGISFIATVYPSQSAARVLPAEALRYE